MLISARPWYDETSIHFKWLIQIKLDAQHWNSLNFYTQIIKDFTITYSYLRFKFQLLD